MSRRYPGAGARSGSHNESGLARHRWAASLGSASEEGLLGDLPAVEAPDKAATAETPTPAGFRWRTGRHAAALIAVITVVLGGWFWWQAVDGAPTVLPLGDPTRSDAAESPGPDEAGANGAPATPDPAAAGPASAGAVTIIVHVAGAVARSGVVALPRGSRIHEAIKAAGGSTPTADLDRLNLAAVLEDGQKVIVPERGSPDTPDPSAGPSTGAGGTGTSGAGGPPAGKINLNTAGVEELATLPRVGPVLAQRIVDWRKQHGRFGSVEELDAVEGVGPKLLEALLPLVRI